MKKINILFALLIILLCSCEKEDSFKFIGGSQIYLSSGDSTSFSFAVKPTDYVVHEMRIPIKITGVSSSVDREVTIEINSKETIFAKNGNAQSGGHFTIEKCIVPKDSVNSVVVVKLYRDNIKSTLEALGQKDSDMAVAFTILESDDFKGGLGEEKMNYIITFNDRLTIPKNWSSIQTYFGAPSLVKYQFMIDTLGISEFPTTGDNKYEPGELMFFKDKLKTALVKYNKEHDEPLRDENNNLVSFG